MRHYWYRAKRLIGLLLVSCGVATPCFSYDVHIEDAGTVFMENWSSISCRLENISNVGLLPGLPVSSQAAHSLRLNGSWWRENKYQLFCAADLLYLGTNPDFIVDIKQPAQAFSTYLDYKVVKASKKVHLCKYKLPASTDAVSLRISEAPCGV